MNKQNINTLKDKVNILHEDKIWDVIKPSTQRQSEYLAQARADLERCKGNLVRAERCEGAQ